MASATFLRISARPVPRQRSPVSLQARARCFSRSTPLSSHGCVGFQLHRRSRATLRCKAKDNKEDEEEEDEDQDALDKKERMILSWKSAVRGMPKEKAPNPLDDPDMQRRIQENKRWRRDMSPTEAWDIDKELDAVTYKRSALESLLREDEEKEHIPSGSDAPVSRPLRCICCDNIISDENQLMKKAKQHEHPRMTPTGSLQVFRVFSGAKGVVQEKAEPDFVPWLFPPRKAAIVHCANCEADVGYAVADDPLETVGAFFALRASSIHRCPETDTLPEE